MNRNSYAFVIPAAIGLLLFTALILAWVFILWPSVHFKPVAEKTCLIASPLLAIVWMLHQWRSKNAEFLRKKPLDRLKVFLGALIASAMVMAALLATIILLTCTTFSSYVTAYEYVAGGSRSCSGIEVFDAEVNKKIKICHAGSRGDHGWVQVQKRSGPLGIVVVNTLRQ
ncbi:hypothetical protein LRS56_30490 [Pseudomonas poae]|nr:hypothetical protein LRS56_30490 [Pseudomonas poae]